MRGKSLNPNPLPTPLAMIPNPPQLSMAAVYPRVRDFAPPQGAGQRSPTREEGEVAVRNRRST
jgi:hypothetical protein